mgnify:CR=1 FL=1
MALNSDGDETESEKDRYKECIPDLKTVNEKKNTSKNKYGFSLKSPNVAF